MKKLKIAYTDKALEIFGAIAGREQADLARTDFTDVAAVVITDQDKDVLEKEMIAAFKIPVLMIKTGEGLTEDALLSKVYRVMDLNETDHDSTLARSRVLRLTMKKMCCRHSSVTSRNMSKMVTPSSTAQATRAVLSSASIRQAVHSMNSSARILSALTSATLT